MRYGALPQVTSNFVSYTLLRFEINVREPAVMGFVGAGGIGQDLIEAIRKFYYTDVSAILLLILVTVAIIDTLTSHGAPPADRPGGEALMPDASRDRSGGHPRPSPAAFRRASTASACSPSLTGVAAFALLLFGMAQLGFFGGKLLAGACAGSSRSRA